MTLLQDFHFLRPLWFIALVPALLLCIWLLLRQRQSVQWIRYVAPNLLPYLLDQVQLRRKRWPLLGLLGLWVLAIVALAGPVWQKIPQPVERNTEALVICWDLSPSMLAEDVKPSRLVRSRLKLIDLLHAREDGQIALIAYSAEAYTVTPLTDDHETLINLLPALSPTTLPSVGSNPEMALTTALQLLKDGGIRRGNILFLTDEIDPSAFASMADELSRTPHQLTLWGVGTDQGAPIPLPEGGFAKNNAGEIVVARLNEDRLRQFAVEQRAYYVPMVTTNSDIETLQQLFSPNAQSSKRTDRTFDQWFEHGQYLALLLLPFVALLFRRGWLVGIWLLAALPFGYSPQAQALEWRDLWSTQDQQAQADMQKGDAEAATRFTTPERRGTALYNQEKFGEAAQEFAKGDDAVDAYNRGNALTRAGEFDKAVKAYDEALRQRPDFAEARDNREIANQLAELQKQQEQQQENKQQNNEQQKDQQQSGDQQQSESGESGDDSQQGDGQQQNADNKQNSSESSENGQAQSPEEMTEEEARERAAQQQQMANQPPGDEENPYSQAAEQAQSEQQENAEQQAREKGEQQEEPGEAQQAMVEAQPEPMTEEQQMLEQWLRKVPDDPSGLMRNKFRYQYMQRRQSLREGNNSNNEAEQRW